GGGTGAASAVDAVAIAGDSAASSHIDAQGVQGDEGGAHRHAGRAQGNGAGSRARAGPAPAGEDVAAGGRGGENHRTAVREVGSATRAPGRGAAESGGVAADGAAAADGNGQVVQGGEG